MDDINIYDSVKKSKYEFKNDIPILKKERFYNGDWKKVQVKSFKHRKKIKNLENTILEFFCGDKVLENVWNNPRNGIISYVDAFAVATPDFSLRSNMPLVEKVRNISRSRLMGCFWQSFGIKIIPTMQWCGIETYDFSFKTVEEGTPVIISTMGCHKKPKEFLDGYKVMMDIVKPEMVICVGGLIDGMFGIILPVELKDTFAPSKFEQIKLMQPKNIVCLGNWEKYYNKANDIRMRINEYNCLEDFINEYNGKREKGDDFHQGLEFKYKDKEYRICREYDETFYVYRIEPEFKISYIGKYKLERPIFTTLGVVDSMKGLLESTFIDNRPFKEIVMDDYTLMLSKD